MDVVVTLGDETSMGERRRMPADTRGFRKRGGETCTALSSCGMIKNLTAKKQIQWRRSGDLMLSLESIDEE